MAIIPTARDVPRASLGALRAPAVRVSPQAFGAGIGEGLAEGSKAIIDVLEKQRDENETTETKGLDNNLSDDFRLRMSGDGTAENTGYYSTRGKDALDQFEAVSEANKKAIAELAGTASSDRVKTKFSIVAESRRQSEADKMLRHVAKERIDFANTTSAARQDRALQDAVTYYNDPKVVGDSIAVTRNEAKDAAGRNGLGAEATKVLIDQAETKIHVSVLNRMTARGEDVLAQDYFTKNQTRITDVKARAILEEQIIETSKIEESQRLASDIWNSAGGDAKKAKDIARDELTGKMEDTVILRLNRLKAEAKEENVEIVQNWADKNFTGDADADRAKARKKFSGVQETLAVAEINARAREGAESEVEKARKIADELGEQAGLDYQQQREAARARYKNEGNMLTRVLTEIDRRETEQDKVRKKTREEAYKQAVEITSQVGKSWADVPIDIRTKLSAIQQRTLQNQTIPANPELNGTFEKMLTEFTVDMDDTILTYDFNQHIGEMPAVTLQQWQRMQTKLNSNDPREKFIGTQISRENAAAKRLISSVFRPKLRVKSRDKKRQAEEQKALVEQHLLEFITNFHEENPGKRLGQEEINREVYSLVVSGSIEEREMFGIKRFADQRSDEDVLKVTTLGTAAEPTFRPDLEDADNLNLVSKATGIPTANIPQAVRDIEAEGRPVTIKNIRKAKKHLR